MGGHSFTTENVFRGTLPTLMGLNSPKPLSGSSFLVGLCLRIPPASTDIFLWLLMPQEGDNWRWRLWEDNRENHEFDPAGNTKSLEFSLQQKNATISISI